MKIYPGFISDKSVASAEVSGYIYQRGAQWPIEVKPKDPCADWKCPVNAVSSHTVDISYHGYVFLDTSLMKVRTFQFQYF